MHCYLAGPMRGHHLFNFPAFFAAALALRGLGHGVVNPAERDMAHGIDPSQDEFSQDFDLADAFRFDFQAIMNCGNVVLLAGWQASRGVRAELVVAQMTGARIFELDPTRGDMLREIQVPEPVIEFEGIPREPVSESPKRSITGLQTFSTTWRGLLLYGEGADGFCDQWTSIEVENEEDLRAHLLTAEAPAEVQGGQGMFVSRFVWISHNWGGEILDALTESGPIHPDEL